MTSEKAIEILRGAIKKPNTKDGYMGQALDMAIKALERQKDINIKCEECPYGEIEVRNICNYNGHGCGWD